LQREKFEETVNKRQTTKIMNFKWRWGQRQRRISPNFSDWLKNIHVKIPSRSVHN